jgi:hypothetical protein
MISRQLFCILISFFFIIPLANATIGIGVEPSLVNITLVYNMQISIMFKFWNEGDTDAIYQIVPEDSLKDFIVLNDSSYYQGENFTVPNKTNMVSTYVLKEILFRGMKNETSKFETGLSIYGEPIVSQGGMITIRRRIFVKMFVENYPSTITTTTTTSTTTTTQQSSSGSSSSGSGTTTTTTTTTYIIRSTLPTYQEIQPIRNFTSITNTTPTTIPRSSIFGIQPIYITVAIIVVIAIVIGAMLFLRWY